MTTNITEDHRRAFEALTSGEAVTVCPPRQEAGEPEYVISPLFISITEDMVLTDHNGRQA